MKRKQFMGRINSMEVKRPMEKEQLAESKHPTEKKQQIEESKYLAEKQQIEGTKYLTEKKQLAESKHPTEKKQLEKSKHPTETEQSEESTHPAEIKRLAEGKQPGIRINKYLSAAGVCSRREADRQVEGGNVRINGQVASIGDRVQPGDQVSYMGRPVEPEEDCVLLAVNKPKGIVCTAEKREKNNIVDFLNYPKRIYPIGRLDKQSEGLLLMTNKGEFVNKIMRSGNRHEKEYLVTVNKAVTDSFLRGLAGGVPILGTMTRKCKAERTGKRSFRIVLTQGMNRQIRRMCEYFGYRVVSLKRVRIMNIHLGELPAGQFRLVTPQELERLEEMLKGSSNDTVRFENSSIHLQLWEEEE